MSEKDYKDNSQRKRLGQYFSGPRLARLLATLCDAASAESVIDPMAGTGDMLLACLSVSKNPKTLGAIEIDPAAAAKCESKLTGVSSRSIVNVGSAFDSVTWKNLADKWDLVITNPPYVRYQIASSSSTGRVSAPSAKSVRLGLGEIIERSFNEDSAESRTLISLATHFSGLSDLAVPSWLLCVSKVKIGGRLGIVVPDTWLSRDYATPVVYALRRFFDIEYVVIDKDASWFEHALVRTNLVVARRVADKKSALLEGGHHVVSISSRASSKQSLVGNAFPGENPDTDLCRWLNGEPVSGARVESYVSSHWSDEKDLIESLNHKMRRQRWAQGKSSRTTAAPILPREVRRIVGKRPKKLTNLEGIGWSVGQGLRTGANDFFYLTAGLDGFYRSALLPQLELTIPDSVLRPAIKRQSDLVHLACESEFRPTSFLIYLEGWALPEHIEKTDDKNNWNEITGDLAKLVRYAQKFNYRRGGKIVSLPDLSAVRTNRRKEKSGQPERFWYHLPKFVTRHTPDIFLARVNSQTPRAFLNHDRAFVIDANFSTLWATCTGCQLTPHALIALFFSSWSKATMESIATVMGGGALKVEATHLRRMPIPHPNLSQSSELHSIGRSLSRSSAAASTAQKSLNQIVTEILFPSSSHMSAELESLAVELAALRNRPQPAKARLLGK